MFPKYQLAKTKSHLKLKVVTYIKASQSHQYVVNVLYDETDLEKKTHVKNIFATSKEFTYYVMLTIDTYGRHGRHGWLYGVLSTLYYIY